MKEATLDERDAELRRREAVLAEEREALRNERAEARRREQRERAAVEAEKVRVLRQNLEEATGSDRFPEDFRSRLWSHAWQEGHAYGYESIANQYHALMELMEGFQVTPMK